MYQVTATSKSINATEKVAHIRLQALRNRVLRVEVALGVTMLALNTAGLVIGLFGMNLLSGFEEDPRFFYLLALSLTGGVAFGVRFAFRRLRNTVYK
mmetsp:Transcript_20059/g.49754  ORF Transcript_20059/g.49754 Transcript_20059/m.49754 type:complete len:97 (+) Transcript_20059:391-681(+)